MSAANPPSDGEYGRPFALPDSSVVLPHEAFEGLVEQDQVRLLCEYSAKTGHRLRIEYASPQCHETQRVIVVVDVKDKPPSLGLEPIAYINAIEPVGQGAQYRSFLLERIRVAALDGGA